LELRPALEEADDLAVLGIGGHPVPGPRRELRRARLDDLVEPLRHHTIGLRLLGALPHRGALLGRESLLLSHAATLPKGPDPFLRVVEGSVGASLAVLRLSEIWAGRFASLWR